MKDNVLVEALNRIYDRGRDNEESGFECSNIAGDALAEYKTNGIKPLLCDGWRDVRKELPEKGVAVLILVTCLSYHNIEQGTYIGGNEWVNCWFSIRDKESYPVTHWMPLPDPSRFHLTYQS